MKEDPAIPDIGKSDNSSMAEWLLDFNAKLTDEDEKLKEDTLKELKDRITSAINGWEHVLDDRHLLKFLRYTKFDANAAFEMLRQIQKTRLADPENFLPAGKGPLDFAHVYNLQCVEVLPYRNPRDGSAIVILRKGSWTPNIGVDITVAQCAASFLADYVLDDERVQRHGVTLILNCLGVGISSALNFLPIKSVPQLVNTVQDAYPVNFVSVHVLHQPLMCTMLFNVVRPFLKKRNVVHFHGSNVKQLHEFFPKEILPRDLLGEKEVDYKWLPELVYKRHDEYVSRSIMPQA